MLSFKSILLAAAAFASIVFAVPTPEVGNSLNIAQRSPAGGVPGAGALPELPATGTGLISSLPVVGGGGDSTPAVKRGGGKSCKEVFQTCHDGIVEIIVDIS